MDFSPLKTLICSHWKQESVTFNTHKKGMARLRKAAPLGCGAFWKWRLHYGKWAGSQVFILLNTSFAAEVREGMGAILQSLWPNMIRLRFKVHSSWSGAAVQLACSWPLQPSVLLFLDVPILEFCTCEVGPGRKEKTVEGLVHESDPVSRDLNRLDFLEEVK